MKRYLTIVFLALCAAGVMSAQDTFTTNLTWFDFTSPNRPVTVEEFWFSQPVTVLDGAEVTIECDGEVMLRAKSITTTTYDNGIRVEFEKTLLPKGRTYTVVIHEGSLALAENPDVVNPRMEFEYTIMDSLGIPSVCGINQQDNYKRISEVRWSIYDMCQVVKGSNMQLYCEDKLIGKYEMESYMGDWNMYYVKVHFSSPLILKKGVRYTLVIPEGSLVSVYRDDIFNERGEYEIYGWGQSGIETPVTAADDEPLYDLLGRPVANPVPSTIYISRSGMYIKH